MVVESLGTSNVRSPRPSFTYTKTLARSPLSATIVSAVLVPLHAGSWLMSIFAGFGAVPSSLTVPFTVAAVAGSIGADVPAGLVSPLGDVPCSSFVVFLLQPAINHRPSRHTRN